MSAEPTVTLEQVSSVASAALAPAAAKRLDILFCTYHYFPVPAGGAERQARLQAEELVRRGHKVTVVCPRSPGVPSGPVNGVFVRRLPNLNIRYTRRISYLAVLGIYALFCVRRYDLVHIHLSNLQADVVVPIAHLLGRPVYAKVACGGRVGEVGHLSRIAWLTRWVGLRNADRVQALSDQIVGELRSIDVRPERIVSIPNGIDLKEYVPCSPDRKLELRLKLGLPERGPIVVYTGRFARYKGVLDLVNVWRAGEWGEATLLLVGTARTVASVGRIDEGPNLIVRDWTDTVVEYLQAADVFVNPTYADGMSNALLEAMACGLVPIATHSGAADAMIAPGTSGILFDAGDRKALAMGLSSVLADRSLRASLARGAEAGAQAYGIEQVVDSVERAYYDILAAA